ncbi:hypothetical protein MXB_3220, partial [Myxobolus squamalis]
MKYMWMPLIITSDFEFSLIAALKHEFPASRVMCFYFHLMKPIETKTKKYKIRMKIHQGSFKILKIRFIQSLTEHQEELNSFWTYFTRTWIMRFNPTLWSLSNTNNFKIFGRTNNGVERYNRRIGDHFANAHP